MLLNINLIIDKTDVNESIITLKATNQKINIFS